MRRILMARGKVLNSPKPIFRDSAQEGMIENPEIWFGFIVDRNETVHTYDKTVANKIFSNLASFDREMAKFLANIRK